VPDEIPLVLESDSWWMVVCLLSGLHLPLADSLLPVAVARFEAEQAEDDLADVLS